MTGASTPSTTRPHRNWIGLWLMGVALVHIVAAVLQNIGVLGDMIDDGLFNAVPDHPVVGAVVWSLMFGAVAFVGGIAVAALERSGARVPLLIAWLLLIISVTGTILAPISGFWLLAPAVIGIFLRHRRPGLNFPVRDH